jgi:hypothetical protein
MHADVENSKQKYEDRWDPTNDIVITTAAEKVKYWWGHAILK